MQGFQDTQRARMLQALDEIGPAHGFQSGHPREILGTVAEGFHSEANATWLA